MRKRIVESLFKKYLRTFPPISKNGNGILGDIRRVYLTVLINIISCGKSEQMLREIMDDYMAIMHNNL